MHAAGIDAERSRQIVDLLLLLRLLRGKLDLSDGTVRMRLQPEQGNVVLSSAIGCDAMAIVPEGSGPVPAGTKLKGFLL